MLPSYVIDASPLAPAAAPLASTARCEGDEVLGVAVVVASRGLGTLAWGHASLRVVTCEGGAPRDVEYEAYRLGRWNERLLRLEHGGADYVSEGYLQAQRGGLVLFRNERPVDGGWFEQVERDENRDLWEVWLALPPERLLEVARGADTAYEQQRATFQAGGDLPERYVATRRNCTAPLRDLLPELDPGSALPFAWLRALEGDAALRVVHPSAHLLARAGAEGETPRRRVAWRRRPELGDLGPRAAVGPWTAP